MRTQALCLVFSAWAGMLCAATYHVDSTAGDDRADGLTERTAWKSLARVNAASLRPGDCVLFKRGGLWRGQLRPQSGEPGRPVLYGTYGSGTKPILQQSVDRSRPEDWERIREGLWATRRSEPKLLEPVWPNVATDRWTLHAEQGMRGTLRRIDGEGAPFWRLTCTNTGPNRRNNTMQLWGPTAPSLPENLLVRLQFRAQKPVFLPFDALCVTEGARPFRNAYAGRHTCSDALADAWKTVDLLLDANEKGTTQTSRLHASIGHILKAGNVLDFRVIGAWRREPDAKDRLDCDIGIFIADHGKRWGVKKWGLDGTPRRMKAWKVPTHGRWPESVRMANDLDYLYDEVERRVYVVSAENPGARFTSIELAETAAVVKETNCHDIVYDGLWVRYGAAHGFGGGNTANLVIRNCDISWIGGGLQFWRRSAKTGALLWPVRYGNGIEFWGNCRNNLVERNRLWEIYDAALTNQGGNDDETEITWRDNVIWNSEYSFEYWNRKRTCNVTFEHNTCVDAGYGWAHAQRPDVNGAHLMYYSNRAATTNFVVRNNIFCRATEWTCRTSVDWRAALDQNHNLVWNEPGIPLLRWLDGKQLLLADWTAYRNLGFEKDGLFAEPQFIDPAARDYRLKPGSPGTTLATDGGTVGARMPRPAEMTAETKGPDPKTAAAPGRIRHQPQ